MTLRALLKILEQVEDKEVQVVVPTGLVGATFVTTVQPHTTGSPLAYTRKALSNHYACDVILEAPEDSDGETVLVIS